MPVNKEDQPAFPLDASQAGIEPCFGMTLRDYFAGQALVALVPEYNGEGYLKKIATESYRIADAMLTERKIVRAFMMENDGE